MTLLRFEQQHLLLVNVPIFVTSLLIPSLYPFSSLFILVVFPPLPLHVSVLAKFDLAGGWAPHREPAIDILPSLTIVSRFNFPVRCHIQSEVNVNSVARVVNGGGGGQMRYQEREIQSDWSRR